MIVLNDVTKTFAQHDEICHALAHVFLHVKEGECVVIRGASGSGKSTLLSLIAGLLKPTSGEVSVMGKEISKLPEHLSAQFRRAHIGFIFQKFHLIPSLTVEENIIAPLIPDNPPLKTLHEKAHAAMNQFELASKAKRAIKQLSGGEQQRVAIARALINTPSIVLADEPTANLDAKLSKALMAQLSELKRRGVTLIIATHDPLFFEQPFVDRIVELRNGNVVS